MKIVENKYLESIQVQPDSYESSITADICLFGFKKGHLRILLVKRTVGKYKNSWLLPGGIMDDNETIDECAHKVLRCLIGVENVHISQVKAYTNIKRHPVKRVITISFYALIKPENHPIEQKMNVTQIKWFRLNELPNNIGFDHLEIIIDAHNLLKLNLKSNLIFGELLPETFTLNEMQSLYESILNKKLDRRNFRKKILQMNLLENTGIIKKGIKGGPYLFRKIK
ncbi:NUDIX domain-containing protein [Sabulilitoribacter arenilitoris]|uniref:NUDIX domain-containing protein n=1 Tax=Wocania arenilitoris TaxID=2044858 RepID=A0AAE3JL47_9FLAO|nr:NUDIX domain-containing protein [Wocania arenilitoris]MCF7568853.1 NUDIX domain-containing protein [Wocania arenilitoris]